MHEAADFDSAIGAVMRFLKDAGIDDETLLVVTADHETGGLTLNVDSKLALGFEPKWTTTYHTAAPVPVFSCGPGADLFTGVTNHERVGRRLIECVVGHEVKFEYPPARGEPEAMKPSRSF
jgi:alkaline phosphatase